MKHKDIIDNLFGGNICGLTDIGNNLSKNKTAREINKTLKQLEKDFFNSQDELTSNLVEEIISYYRKLLYINGKQGYREGIRIGFELAEALKNPKLKKYNQ